MSIDPTSVPNGSPHIRASTIQHRAALRIWIVNHVTEDLRLNYGVVRPLEQHQLPTAWLDVDGEFEAYTEYIGFLAKYDIAIQGRTPKITNNLRLPPGHKPAEDIEKSYRKRITLQWFHNGEIERHVAELYVPQELRGVQDMRFSEYVKSLMGVASQCRTEIV